MTDLDTLQPAVTWKLCACPGPGPAPVAPLFLAAHLARDASEAHRLLDQLDDGGLAELEEILRTTMAQTRASLTRRNPAFEADYDPSDMWSIFGTMTQGRSDVRDAVLDRITVGQPPLIDTVNGLVSVLFIEASIITSLHETLPIDTRPLIDQLRREGHRLIHAAASGH